MERLLRLIPEAWGPDTCSGEWDEDCPSRGQCAVTALVVQDELGGKLIRTIVGDEFHYCNILDDNTIIDLAGGQFENFDAATQYPDGFTVRERHYVLGFGNTAERYAILKARVAYEDGFDEGHGEGWEEAYELAVEEADPQAIEEARVLIDEYVAMLMQGNGGRGFLDAIRRRFYHTNRAFDMDLDRLINQVPPLGFSEAECKLLRLLLEDIQQILGGRPNKHLASHITRAIFNHSSLPS